MKTSVFLYLLSFALLLSPKFLNAQDNRKATMTATKKSDRVSPAKTSSVNQNGLNVTIEYSSPGVKGRPVWGELVPFGKVWRTGANEATTIEFNRDVMIDGQRLRAGKYALFTIPGESEWTVILNTVPDQWGAFKYDESKDALRFKVIPQKAPQFTERLQFDAKGDDRSGQINVIFQWENLMLSWSVN